MNTKPLLQFLSEQMDGAKPPLHNSPEVNQLAQAVGEMQKASQKEQSAFALEVLGLVIDRVRSGIQAEHVLHAFIRKED